MSLIRKYYLNTTAKVDVLKVTEDVKRAMREAQIGQGFVVVLVNGGVAGLALLEPDPKIHEELKVWIEKQFSDTDGKAPPRRSGTGKNSAHLRAALLSSQLTIPVADGRLCCGSWQEIMLFDFDDKSARREIVVQVVPDPSAAPAPQGERSYDDEY